MVIHACVLSQALFSTELHWRTKIVRFGDHVRALVWQLADLRRLSLGHTWLYSALTRYDSSSALFDATPACPHTLSGPVLHTYVSDSSTQSPDALFSIVLKPPAGVFSTTDRRFFDHRPATDRLPTGYHRLPTGYRRLPTGYRRLPTGYRRLPTGYRRLPTGYRRLPPATDRLPTGYRPATDRLPTGYRRLPPTTAGYQPATDRLPPVQKKKKKKKKKKNSFWRLRNATRALYKQSSRFGDWEMPIVPKNFRDTCYKMRTVCVSLYIYGH